MAEAEAWQRERQQLLDERRARLAGLPCEIPDSLHDPDDSLPRFPWAWFQGNMIVLRPVEPGGRPNRFGGSHELTWRGLARGCRPHLLLRLRPSSLPLGLPAMPGDDLPLFHPFQSSSEPELAYARAPDGVLVAGKSPRARRADHDWPYPDYPAVLPPRDLEVEGPFRAPYLALFPTGDRRTLSVQDLPEDGGQFLIIVVTAREKALGVSLLGPEAEDNAVQIVFVVNPATGAVWSYNHCT
ncbi:MAG TPA: hypothetical protein PKE47_10340 [Verrucomicrobiota bacterium]|nr:hypothetical protein [Verrucomicrobiota bacterium]